MQGKTRDSQTPTLAIRADAFIAIAGIGRRAGYQRLDERGIRIKSITPEGDGLVIRLDSPEQQLLAREALENILPPGYTIALNESPLPGRWVRKFARAPLDLG